MKHQDRINMANLTRLVLVRSMLKELMLENGNKREYSHKFNALQEINCLIGDYEMKIDKALALPIDGGKDGDNE